MSTRHPDPAEIAALGEDLLTADESMALREHLANCDACTSVAEDLELLRQGLRTLYPVEPMPTEVAARLDAALTSEAALVSRETTALPATHDRQARRGRRPQFVLAAAGATIALGVGGLITQTMTPSDSDSAGSAEAVRMQDNGTQHLTDEHSLEVAVQDLLGGEQEEASSRGDDAAGTESAPEPGDTSDGAGADEEADSQILTSVPSCISSVINRTEQPLAASEDYLYQGVASYVVVLPHFADPGAVDAYVIDSACADEGTAPDPDDLLIKHSYSR